MYNDDFNNLNEQKGPVEPFFNPDDYESLEMENGMKLVNWKLKPVPEKTHPQFTPGNRVEYKNKKIWTKQGTIIRNMYGAYHHYVEIAWDGDTMNVYNNDGEPISGITEYKGNLKHV